MRPSPAPLPTLVVADDHRILLDAFVYLVQEVATVVGTATNGEELLVEANRLRPDLVVTDLSMPGLSGFEIIRRIRTMPQPPATIVLTFHTDPGMVKEAMDSGARGYVVKHAAADDLRAAIRIVSEGGTYRSAIVDHEDPPRAPYSPLGNLTHREREVLSLVVDGLTAREIGERLGITERTVAFHKERMRRRIGVGSTIELVNILVRSEQLRV